MAEIIYDGQPYWTIAQRYHAGRRRKTKLIGFAAVNHMRQLQPNSQAVRNRVNGFIARHQAKSSTLSPNDDGPHYA